MAAFEHHNSESSAAHLQGTAQLHGMAHLHGTAHLHGVAHPHITSVWAQSSSPTFHQVVPDHLSGCGSTQATEVSS